MDEESPSEQIDRITLEMVKRLKNSEVLDPELAEAVIHYMKPLALIHTTMLGQLPGCSKEEVLRLSKGFGQYVAIFARVCFDLGREHQRIKHLFNK